MIFKMIQNNVIMIELTISVKFKQFEDPNFNFFSGDHSVTAELL